MSSGYEKSPDYGSPRPLPLSMQLAALAILVGAVIIVRQLSANAPSDCRQVSASEIEATDGKAVLRLDKLNLKAGECVRIAP